MEVVGDISIGTTTAGFEVHLLAGNLERSSRHGSSTGARQFLEKCSHSSRVPSTSCFDSHVYCEEFCRQLISEKDCGLNSAGPLPKALSAHITGRATPSLFSIVCLRARASAGSVELQMAGWTEQNRRAYQTQKVFVCLHQLFSYKALVGFPPPFSPSLPSFKETLETVQSRKK